MDLNPGVAVDCTLQDSAVKGKRLFANTSHNDWITEYQEWWPLTVEGLQLFHKRNTVGFKVLCQT